MNRQSLKVAEGKYYNDLEFHTLVDMIYKMMCGDNYTYRDLLEAVTLAATKYDMFHYKKIQDREEEETYSTKIEIPDPDHFGKFKTIGEIKA